MRKATKADKASAKTDLMKWIPQGTMVYTICRRITKSGMGAWYSVVVFLPGDAGILRPDWSVHALTGLRFKEFAGHMALWMSGRGYNRARALVDQLAYELYGKADALRQESL